MAQIIIEISHPGHLRTFKKILYDQIPIDDFMFKNDWVKTAFDGIYYTALIEMTEPRLRYFYDKSLLVYNVLPHNDTFLDIYKGTESPEMSQSVVSEFYRRKKPHAMITRTHVAVLFYSFAEFKKRKDTVFDLISKSPLNKYHFGIVGGWDIEMFSGFHGCKFYNIDLIKKSAVNTIEHSKDILVKLFSYYLFRNNWPSEYVILDSFSFFDDKADLNFNIDSNCQQSTYPVKLIFDKDYKNIETYLDDSKRHDCSVFGKVES